MRYKDHPYFERFKYVISDPANLLITKENPWAGQMLTSSSPKSTDFRDVRKGLFPHFGDYKVSMNVDSYYGDFIDILALNSGVHEPSEELAFQRLLERVYENPKRKPLMVELGSYWCFYSIWFLNRGQWKNGRVLSIEAGKDEFEAGWENLLKCAPHGKFIVNESLDYYHALINRERIEERVVKHFLAKVGDANIEAIRMFTLQELLHKLSSRESDMIDILHIDIQADELKVLNSSKDILKNKVAYIVLSTHTDQLHNDCISVLRECGFEIEGEVTQSESLCEDGIVVASHRREKKIGLEDVRFYKKSELIEMGGLISDEELVQLMQKRLLTKKYT